METDIKNDNSDRQTQTGEEEEKKRYLRES